MLNGNVLNAERITEKDVTRGYMVALSEIVKVVILNILITDGERLLRRV
jgi:hypothetical protein